MKLTVDWTVIQQASQAGADPMYLRFLNNVYAENILLEDQNSQTTQQY